MCILEGIILVLSIFIGLIVNHFICINLNIYYFWIGILLIPFIYIILYALWLLFIFILGLFLNKKKEIKHFNNFYYWIVKETDIFLLHLLRIKINKVDFDKIPKNEKYLLVCNHVSNFDQMVLIAALRNKNDKMAWISKPENMNFPIAGPLIHHTGFISINRESVFESIKAFKKAGNYLLNDECSIGVCPEGKRNKTDKILLDFHPAIFEIARIGKVPIIVIGLKNTKKIKNNAPFKKTSVEIKVIDSIKYNKDNDIKDISNKVYKELYEYLKED